MSDNQHKYSIWDKWSEFGKYLAKMLLKKLGLVWGVLYVVFLVLLFLLVKLEQVDLIKTLERTLYVVATISYLTFVGAQIFEWWKEKKYRNEKHN